MCSSSRSQLYDFSRDESKAFTNVRKLLYIRLIDSISMQINAQRARAILIIATLIS